MLNIKRFTFNLLCENTYLVWNDSFCVVVDPGFFIEKEKLIFFRFLQEHSLTPQAALLTHGHLDHIYGAKDLQEEYGSTVYLSDKDKFLLPENIKTAKVFGVAPPRIDFSSENVLDGDVLKFGDAQFKVLATPGHSPGGVCFLEEKEKVLFSGDTLFAGTIGRSDLQGGDYDVEMESIFTKLLVLDGDVRVLPGHGNETSIAEERTQNPMFEPFNEPFENESES